MEANISLKVYLHAYTHTHIYIYAQNFLFGSFVWQTPQNGFTLVSEGGAI